PAPQDASLNSVRRSKSSSSAKSPAGARPEPSASKLPARWMGSLAIEILRPPTARRITPRTLTGNAPAAGIRPLARRRIGFPLRLKASKTAARTIASGRDEGMTGRTSLTIVLAAGEGTRMRSALPKVLHPVAARSLLAHVLGAAPKGTGDAL